VTARLPKNAAAGLLKRGDASAGLVTRNDVAAGMPKGNVMPAKAGTHASLRKHNGRLGSRRLSTSSKALPP
jgi:hypothetical protein